MFEIQRQQVLISFEQILRARCRGQGAGFLRHRNRIVKPPGLSAGRRQSANVNRRLIMRQFTDVLGKLNGLCSIPDGCLRTGRWHPGQIVQRLNGIGIH